jgi:AcrR family transcriptional regulator
MTAKKTAEGVSKGPGRLSAVDAANLPDRLLDAALAEFSAKGYEGSTMEQIAKAAGASTKTLYARYANKGELLQAVVRRLIERTLSAAIGNIDPRGVEPRLFLVTMLTAVAGEVTLRVGLNRFALAEAHRHPELATFYANAIARGIGIIKNAVEGWRDAGLLPLLGDSEMAATLCLSMPPTGPASARCSACR